MTSMIFSHRHVPRVPFVVGVMIAALPMLAVSAARNSSTSPSKWNPGFATHPVGVIPSQLIAIPLGWPQTASGAITCATCHTRIPTNSELEGPQLRDFDPAFSTATEFCGKCHSQREQVEDRSIHWLAVDRAHGSSEAYRGREGLDSHSRRCLTCHDGVTASESKNRAAGRASRMAVSDQGRNHPIGIAYDNPSRPLNLSPLRPRNLLPERVVLPGGNVACVSCHDLYAQEPFLLTVPIHGSELCLTCHDMK